MGSHWDSEAHLDRGCTCGSPELIQLLLQLGGVAASANGKSIYGEPCGKPNSKLKLVVKAYQLGDGLDHLFMVISGTVYYVLFGDCGKRTENAWGNPRRNMIYKSSAFHFYVYHCRYVDLLQGNSINLQG